MKLKELAARLELELRGDGDTEIFAPAPIEAAKPTKNAAQLCLVANAAAKSGASVESEPSISPANPG